MYISGSEKVLYYVGYVFSIIAGFLLPSIAIFMGEIINSYNPATSKKDSLEAVKKLCIILQIIGGFLWFSCYIQYSFWQHLSENISFSMREKYVRTLMNQEIEFFENRKVEEIPS
jgi:ABC-type multidrug transport system fused ATPase/permease subunit